jgi:hypothetical protein
VRKVALLILCAAACRSRVESGHRRDFYAGASLSAIPAVGLAVEGGKVVHRTDRFDFAIEGELAWQFLSDRDLADDGNTENTDDWVQGRIGVKQTWSPGWKRHLVARYGAVLFRATGTPGIVAEAGDYYGLYGSLGFDVEVAERWTMGPEFRLLLVGGPGFEAVPQFGWHLVHDF